MKVYNQVLQKWEKHISHEHLLEDISLLYKDMLSLYVGLWVHNTYIYIKVIKFKHCSRRLFIGNESENFIISSVPFNSPDFILWLHVPGAIEINCIASKNNTRN